MLLHRFTVELLQITALAGMLVQLIARSLWS
jgi:hypothetical protein